MVTGGTVLLAVRGVKTRTELGGTCADINWSTATPPLAASVDSRTVDTNLSYTTRSVQPARPGCYTFAAIATNNFVTGGDVPSSQGFGDPSELVEVRTPPSPPSPSASQTQQAGPPAPTAGNAAGLPQTGASMAPQLLLAAALMAAGAVVLAATRRRRLFRRKR